jgi:flagellar capping protein FliD
MSTSPLNASDLSLNVRQFKAQALQSLFSSDSLNKNDILSPSSGANDIFESMLATAKTTNAPTSTVPTGLDATQAFSRPGQNVVTIINRTDVSFKAQFSELSELKSTLAREGESAQQLASLDEKSSSAEIKSKLMEFIAAYNAGVNRFAPDVAQGGVLEASHEAERARFATRRDIADPLVGALDGLRGGMSALGVAVDPKTGLASIDETQLDNVLAQDTDNDVHTIVDFANRFAQTTAKLNSTGNAQDKQLTNLDRAIHWIADNRESIAQEFGPGAAAKPNNAFAKAAAAYVLIAKQ